MCKDAVRTTVEHVRDARGVQDTPREGNVCRDKGTYKSETVTQHNEGDDKGTVPANKGADDKGFFQKIRE
jgi:hypothetical protein